MVSVRGPDGVRVTHRVVEARTEGASTWLVLRGDANAAPDATPYEVETVDRVLFHVPHAGRVVAAASTRGGTLFVAGLVAALLFLGFGGSEARRPPGGRRRAAPARAAVRRRAPGRGLLLGAVLVGTAVTGASVCRGQPRPPRRSPTSAAVGAAPLGASSMTAPTITCSNAGGLGGMPTIHWAVPQSAGPALSTKSPSRSSSPDRTATTVRWQVQGGLLSLGTYDVTVRSKRGNWLSAASNTQRRQAHQRARRQLRLARLLHTVLLPKPGEPVEVTCPPGVQAPRTVLDVSRSRGAPNDTGLRPAAGPGGPGSRTGLGRKTGRPAQHLGGGARERASCYFSRPRGEPANPRTRAGDRGGLGSAPSAARD